MFKRFISHVNSKKFFDIKKRLLVTVSGGIDSMTLLFLLQQTDYQIAVAHIDHKTRNGQSTKDAEFVEKYCQKNEIPFHLSSFDHSIESSNNFQEAARKFRYEFFKSLEFDYILTAHHKDDNIETILLNILNGRSLNPIPEVVSNIVRPLLIFSKKEIETFAKKHNVPFVQDSSNSESNYDRNYLRNKIIPALQDQFPEIAKKVFGLAQRQTSDSQLLEKLVHSSFSQKNKAAFKISKNDLGNDPHLLFHVIKQHGFNRDQALDIINSIDHTGAMFYSSSAKLLIDRDMLIIENGIDINTTDKSEKAVKISKSIDITQLPQSLTIGKYILHFSLSKKLVVHHKKNEAYFPLDLLKDKLTVRHWIEGDRFFPLGMQGQSQSLKKYFSNSKVNRIEKHQIPLLCNDDKIMWICGYRSDERYKCIGSEDTFLYVRITEGSANI